MRGPFWNPKTGVTGEANYRTFVDADGKTRTVLLDRREKEDVE